MSKNVLFCVLKKSYNDQTDVPQTKEEKAFVYTAGCDSLCWSQLEVRDYPTFQFKHHIASLGGFLTKKPRWPTRNQARGSIIKRSDV